MSAYDKAEQVLAQAECEAQPGPAAAAAADPGIEAVQRTIANRLPGTKAVAMFMCQTTDGLSIETSIEGDTTGDAILNPKDPAHAIALYVQHNALDVLVQAAAWFSGVAAAQKRRRESSNGGAPAAANASVLVAPRTEPVVQSTIIVDANGQAMTPSQQPKHGASEAIVLDQPVQPHDGTVLGLPNPDEGVPAVSGPC